MARPGTSVVGGYVALADATPLTAGRREALMLSDGIALPETVVAVDLSNFSSIGMYGVGQTEPPPSTPEVDRLARSWHAWLTKQGARQVVVSTQGYSSKWRRPRGSAMSPHPVTASADEAYGPSEPRIGAAARAWRPDSPHSRRAYYSPGIVAAYAGPEASYRDHRLQTRLVRRRARQRYGRQRSSGPHSASRCPGQLGGHSSCSPAPGPH